jgi:hypothetical protein
MQPWKEDSFVCDEIVKLLWRSGTDAVLPQPGFCTNTLRYAIGKRSEDGHAH